MGSTRARSGRGSSSGGRATAGRETSRGRSECDTLLRDALTLVLLKLERTEKVTYDDSTELLSSGESGLEIVTLACRTDTLSGRRDEFLALAKAGIVGGLTAIKVGLHDTVGGTFWVALELGRG